jgi:hypothetical protein
MRALRLGAGLDARPLISPQDITTSATASPYVSLKNALHTTLLVHFGNIAAASADQAVIVTVEAATSAASSATEVALTFRYRLSGVTTANTLGAVTSSAALSVGTTDDNKVLWIDIDHAACETALADASHIRLVVTPDAGATATLVSALVLQEVTYPQLTHQSST